MIDAPEKRVIAGRRRGKGGPLLVALLVSLALLPVKGSIATGPNPIVVENQQQGTNTGSWGGPVSPSATTRPDRSRGMRPRRV